MEMKNAGRKKGHRDPLWKGRTACKVTPASRFCSRGSQLQAAFNFDSYSSFTKRHLSYLQIYRFSPHNSSMQNYLIHYIKRKVNCFYIPSPILIPEIYALLENSTATSRPHLTAEVRNTQEVKHSQYLAQQEYMKSSACLFVKTGVSSFLIEIGNLQMTPGSLFYLETEAI